MIIKNHCHILALALFILFPVLAFSQTAAEMDDMLSSGIVSAARAARFVLGSADLLPQGISGPEAEKAAYDMAASKGWIRISADQSITQKDAAFLIMRAFDLKGGVMYSLFKNPRYAYREMTYRKLIQGRTDQSLKLSGPALLYILDRTLRYTGENADGGAI